MRYSSPWSLSVESLPSASRSRASVERVDAGVDLPERALLRGRVALLDDLRQPAVGVPHDPAQAGRVGHLGGEHGRRRARALVRLDQSGDGLRPQQRHVPVDHHDGAGGVGHRVQRDPHGVPGAELLGLEDRAGLRGDLGQVGARPGRRRARPPPRCGPRAAARPRPARGPAGYDRAAGAAPWAADDFIRLPSPAASTTTVRRWGSGTTWLPSGRRQSRGHANQTTRQAVDYPDKDACIGKLLGRQDSNLKLKNQNLGCCQLHHGRLQRPIA